MTTILVTRPQAAAKQLAEKLIKYHYQPIVFSTIEIRPITPQPTVIDDNWDMVIFISPNAVAHGAYLLKKSSIQHIKIAAVGESTAKALTEQQLTVSIMPTEFSSEGLLACTDLQQVSGKKIALIKGVGGRELLAESLANRGAQVIEIDVYQRCLPRQKIDQLLLDSIDVITVTSVEILQNLCQLTPDSLKHKLLTKRLLVTSKRIRIAAENLGFSQNIDVAKDARSESIIAKLESLQI